MTLQKKNGSCILQGDFCNDGDFLTIDDFVQADCSCNGFGCNDPSACNYSATALHQPELCDFESCQGCLDEAACNYSSNSIIDDGSCYYVGDSCDDGDEASFNDSVQSDCSCEGDYIGGCTYWIACNYDPDAVIDDGSCTFIGELCDDLNPLTFNDIVDENCFCGDIAITNVGEWTFSGFKVYPNPSNGMVWVEAGGAGSRFDVNVYDSASRIVASKTGNRPFESGCKQLRSWAVLNRSERGWFNAQNTINPSMMQLLGVLPSLRRVQVVLALLLSLSVCHGQNSFRNKHWIESL